MKIFNCVLAGVFTFLVGTNLWAIPAGFNVQGRLTDANGVNRNGNDFRIKFSIYNRPGPGLEGLLWSKEKYPVVVMNGNFQIALEDPSQGGEYQFLNDALATTTAYLEIQALGGAGMSGAESPMVPRQPLLSVPYAIRAKSLEESPIPKGTIVMWYPLGPVPDGWCLCDGRTCDGVKTPDLRNKFVMGTDNLSAAGSTGGLETHQHSVDIPSFLSGNNSGYWQAHYGGGNTGQWHHYHAVDPPATMSDPGSSLPPFLRLVFIMKY
ncbi:MAG: hypothetical protein A2X34_01405 [Elusimicrobia bacterium GWC2_51_8]|nr:MAG: hypothetical protein A2X34_01405 [Elusimicrobia bacterium GWC2_51_8]OGR88240.1 MAG: hypothetical protein A2021_04895 [Elusimicrobia bacterium GWF2_52_66]